MKVVSTKNVWHRAALMVAVISALGAFSMLAGCGESARAGDAGETQAGDRRPAAEKGVVERPDNPLGTEDKVGRAGENAKVRADSKVDARNPAKGARDLVPNVGEKVEDAVERASRGDGTSGDDAPEKALLKMKGDARFSGSCSVGEEERRIEGEAPASYSFTLDGEELACDVRAEDGGKLNVAFKAGDAVRSVQRSGADDGEISLTYSEGRLSVEQYSSEPGGQIQSSSISQVSSEDSR